MGVTLALLVITNVPTSAFLRLGMGLKVMSMAQPVPTERRAAVVGL